MSIRYRNPYLEARRVRQAHEPLFQSKRARRLSVRAIQSIIRSLAERASVERIAVTAHTLRHTFATGYLRAHPGKLVDLSTLLGHESLDTTALYTRPSEEDLSGDLEQSPLNLLGE